VGDMLLNFDIFLDGLMSGNGGNFFGFPFFFPFWLLNGGGGGVFYLGKQKMR